MRMHNPPHPGEVLRELCLRPLGVTVTHAATALGVSRKTLSAILNGRAGISPEMAIRLSLAFDTTAESWLNQQLQYDLWQAERNRKKLHVRRLVAAWLRRACRFRPTPAAHPRAGNVWRARMREVGDSACHERGLGEGVTESSGAPRLVLACCLTIERRASLGTPFDSVACQRLGLP
jgi:antitoxin HigA-1